MRKSILILFALGAMIGCDKKEENLTPGIDSYPMEIGTEWEYYRQIILKTYELDAPHKLIEIDTINFTVKVWVDKDTVLNDNIHVKVFKAQEDGSNWTSSQYMSIDSEGLKNYAYANGGAHVFAKKSGRLIPTSFDLNFPLSSGNGILSGGEIVLEAIPTLDIKLPLVNNSKWTYRYPSEVNALQIDKTVKGTETLKLFGKNFHCYKVSWHFLYNPLFDGHEITDWISHDGLVKRLTVYDRQTATNEMGEPVYLYQHIEVLTLKALTIK